MSSCKSLKLILKLKMNHYDEEAKRPRALGGVTDTCPTPMPHGGHGAPAPQSPNPRLKHTPPAPGSVGTRHSAESFSGTCLWLTTAIDQGHAPFQGKPISTGWLKCRGQVPLPLRGFKCDDIHVL